MSVELQSQRGFTMKELIEKENMILEAGDDFDEQDEEEDHLFGFSNNRTMSKDEMLKYLNIEDDEDNSDEFDERSDSVKIIPCGLSFEKQKLAMSDILGDGKIFKSLKRTGVGEVVPKDAMVYIHYMGYFEYQDEPYDSSYLRQSCHRVRLNQGALIKGLEIGIQTMKKHEIAHFIIHPDYAYGELGCPPRVPPNEEVMFVVCLTDFVDNAAADTYENLDQEERKSFDKCFPRAMACHTTANDDFNRNRIKQAVKGYNKVIKILEDIALKNEEEQEKQQKALTKALVNLGICYNKLKEPRRACNACKKVPVPNAKAHFTYGKALMSMGEYDSAMEELHKARMLEPNNHRIVKEIKQLNEKMMQYQAKEKALWSRCLKVKQEDKKMSEFIECARNICNDLFKNPDLLRYPLPVGLNERELDAFRQQAAICGLLFTKHERFGQSSFYICKPNYEHQRQA